MITGAREGRPHAIRRLLGTALARDLRTLVLPGPEIAGMRGLDLDGAGLLPAASPRHANVLVLVGTLPDTLADAATILYAQMMRPRAILALDGEPPAPLPAADVRVAADAGGLRRGVAQLRHLFTSHAFETGISDFDAPVLHARILYTCPMHPQILQAEPGKCPLCGMFLVPREVAAGETLPLTPGAANVAATGDDTHGQGHAAAEGEHHTHRTTRYTCPMHPEVVRDEPGACPKCGMDLVPVEEEDTQHEHAGHEVRPAHDHDDHDTMDFMSMVEVTRDLPRSADGLPMEWIEVPFGPFHPGLPGGLMLTLTLDGDGVAGVTARSLVGVTLDMPEDGMEAADFVDVLGASQPLSPLAYRLLACQALGAASGKDTATDIAPGVVAALRRERVASHLGWLAGLGRQTGFAWLEHQAGRLQPACQRADAAAWSRLSPALRRLAGRLRRAPLLRARLRGIGRTDDGRDAFDRLRERLDQLLQALDEPGWDAAIATPQAPDVGRSTGEGSARVETPRGEARLHLRLREGRVVHAHLQTPGGRWLTRLPALLDRQELGDALTAVASLDLSPWEIPA